MADLNLSISIDSVILWAGFGILGLLGLAVLVLVIVDAGWKAAARMFLPGLVGSYLTVFALVPWLGQKATLMVWAGFAVGVLVGGIAATHDERCKQREGESSVRSPYVSKP